MWIRGAMVASVLILGVLIFVTPTLLGRPTSELSSVPLLIIGMTANKSSFIVYASAAVQAYQYDMIRLTFNDSTPSVNGSAQGNDTYGIYRWVPGNATFTVDAYFVDKLRNFFQYNVTVHTGRDVDNRTFVRFTFPYEKDNLNTVILRYPPDDFRWVIPRKGTLQ